MVEKKGWSVVVDVLTGALASIGMFGDGDGMIRARDELRKRWKGQRKQTLGVVLDAYEVSMEKKVTIWKEPALLLALGTAAVELLNGLGAVVNLPAHSVGGVALAVAVLLASAVVTNARLRIEAEKQGTAMVERSASQARQAEYVEERALVRERRMAGQVSHVPPYSVTGPERL